MYFTHNNNSVHAVISRNQLWFPNTFETQDTIAKMYSFLDAVRRAGQTTETRQRSLGTTGLQFPFQRGDFMKVSTFTDTLAQI